MIYVTIILLLFFLRFLLKEDNLARNQIYYIVLIALFLFSTFRYQVGCDWSGYYYFFLKTKNYEWSQINSANKDIISFAIFYMIHKMGLSYPYVNIIYGVIFFTGVHTLARRQIDPLGFLILLFPVLIINMPMSGIRQAASIGVLCIAFVSFIDRRPISFSFWTLIATGLHFSSIVFLFLLPFASGRYNNNRIAISLLFFIPGIIIILFSDSAMNAVKHYISSDREAFGAYFRVGFLSLTGLYFFIFLKKKWMKEFPIDYNIIHIGALSMILLFALVPISSIISDRFGYYFIPIQAMIFSRLPYLTLGKSKSLSVTLPYIGLFLLLVIWMLSSSHFAECYASYETWIFGIQGRNILRGLIKYDYINYLE